MPMLVHIFMLLIMHLATQQMKWFWCQSVLPLDGNSHQGPSVSICSTVLKSLDFWRIHLLQFYNHLWVFGHWSHLAQSAKRKVPHCENNLSVLNLLVFPRWPINYVQTELMQTSTALTVTIFSFLALSFKAKWVAATASTSTPVFFLCFYFVICCLSEVSFGEAFACFLLWVVKRLLLVRCITPGGFSILMTTASFSESENRINSVWMFESCHSCKHNSRYTSQDRCQPLLVHDRQARKLAANAII